jgi:hypothetical protein
MRTVHYEHESKVSAHDFAEFRKRGFWEVSLIGENKTPKLCGTAFCGDVEHIPRATEFGARFANLVVTSTAHGAKHHTFVLIGHMTIGTRGAIVTPGIDYWPCDAGKPFSAMCSSGGPGFLGDVAPIKVVPGEEVFFTVTVDLVSGG